MPPFFFQFRSIIKTNRTNIKVNDMRIAKENESLQDFQRQVFLEAIFVVEQNDYMGLLVDKAKIILQENGRPFNNESAKDVLAEIEQVLIQLINYRKLNQMINRKQWEVCQQPQKDYDKYFKSRIILAKRASHKLVQFLRPFDT
jgi:hypothetical protein